MPAPALTDEISQLLATDIIARVRPGLVSALRQCRRGRGPLARTRPRRRMRRHACACLPPSHPWIVVRGWGAAVPFQSHCRWPSNGASIEHNMLTLSRQRWPQLLRLRLAEGPRPAALWARDRESAEPWHANACITPHA
eukprot:351259-Chlamydomonas_euryale.AAC.3